MALDHIKALVVRLVLGLHFALVVWRVAVSRTQKYWYLSAAIIPFVLEGLYTVFRRRGVEWKQFSLCFFFYLGATLPGIWLLEIKRTETYQNQNQTSLDAISISGLEIPVRLSSDTWVLVVEEMMLYLMIVSRWFLPRGEVGREQLTQLLFSFIAIASDIMELFSLFDEDTQIRHDTTLTYVILGVWSLSVMQFTITFATAHRPRRERGLQLSPEEKHEDDTRFRRSVLRVELLATVLSLIMQDGPFFSVRMYTMITYHVITYSLVFFTAKNVLVILLLVYKIFLLVGKLCCPTSHRHEADEEEGEHYQEEDSVQESYTDREKLSQGFFSYGVDGSMELTFPEARRSRQAFLNEGFVLDPESGDTRLGRGMEGLAATPDASRPMAFGQSQSALMAHNGMISGGTGGVPNGGIGSGLQHNLSMGGKANALTVAPHNPQGNRTALVMTHQSRTLLHNTGKKIIRISKKSKTLKHNSLNVNTRALLDASKNSRGNRNASQSRQMPQKTQSNANFSNYTPRLLQQNSQQNSSRAAVNATKAIPQKTSGNQNSNNVNLPLGTLTQNAPRSKDTNVATKTLPENAPGHINSSKATTTLPNIAPGHVNSSRATTTLPHTAPGHANSSIATTTLPQNAPRLANSSMATTTLQTSRANITENVSPRVLITSSENPNTGRILQENLLENKTLAGEEKKQQTLQTDIQGGTAMANASRSLPQKTKGDMNAFHLTETPQRAKNNTFDVTAATRSTGSNPQPILEPKVMTAPSDAKGDGARPSGSRPKDDKGKNNRKQDSTPAQTATSAQPQVSPGGKPSGQALLPDLMSVIEGPATPARPMEKTKKYDKLLVTSETKATKGKRVKRSEDGKKKAKRPSENGIPLADMATNSEKPKPDSESGAVVSGVSATSEKPKLASENSPSVAGTDVASEESKLTSESNAAASNTNATSETSNLASDKVDKDSIVNAKLKALSRNHESDDADRDANSGSAHVATDSPAGEEVQKVTAHLDGIWDVRDLSDELPLGQKPQRQNEQWPVPVPKKSQTSPDSSQDLPEPESFLNPLSLISADPSPGLSTTTTNPTEGSTAHPPSPRAPAGRDHPPSSREARDQGLFAGTGLVAQPEDATTRSPHETTGGSGSAAAPLVAEHASRENAGTATPRLMPEGSPRRFVSVIKLES